MFQFFKTGNTKFVVVHYTDTPAAKVCFTYSQ